MNYMDYLFLCGSAALGGAMNSVAGGGSFMTFPAMVFAGYTPLQANVTSTLALAPGGYASAYAYRKELAAHRESWPMLITISLAGSVLGAIVLVSTPEQVFAQMVPWLLLFATLVFTFGRRILKRLPMLHHPAIARAMQFVIAFYGGYFGAGMGILMLAMLQLMGLTHIHRMNALKAVLGCAINTVAMIIYATSNQVAWHAGLIMMCGGIFGGYVGARVAQKCPPEPIRWLVSAIGFSMTAYFFTKI